jgi:N-acetylated-alpha-linked acidic dipeptidase
VASIPSIPISYADAIPILRALNGHGPAAAELPSRWHGGRLRDKGVEYNVGPTPENVALNLYNSMNLTTGTIHNVIGTIPGRELEDEVVIIGNHRDAWGPGAGDPGSGSSALNEVVRSFGAAVKYGWRPLRTIIFISFEGEEFGQVGSRPWIRENLPWLNLKAVAYLNVVVAASGPQFHVKASPLLHRAALNATGIVLSPNQTVAGQTILDVWGGDITPGGGGDAMRFLSDVCISALDLGFSPGISDPVLPYHSQFDTVEWMDAFGDSEWKYHATTAKIWSLMAAYLLEHPVLAVSVMDYATSLRKYLTAVQQAVAPSLSLTNFDLSLLDRSIDRLHEAAVRFDGYTASLASQLHRPRSWWKFWAEGRLRSEIRAANKVYIGFERVFYYEPGLDGEPWSKHVIFEETAWHANPGAFPGLRESLREGNFTNAYV